MTSSWQFWAFLSAVFAALTALFAKIGVSGLPSDYVTLLRTCVVLAVLAMIVAGTGQWQNPASVSWPTRTAKRPPSSSAGTRLIAALPAIRLR